MLTVFLQQLSFTRRLKNVPEMAAIGCDFNWPSQHFNNCVKDGASNGKTLEEEKLSRRMVTRSYLAKRTKITEI